ncbi:MAG: hypothetical protein JNM84_20915 [Planctomycetes bacterium]|nr:hypothetical protein [Planctomycetota bacterium]
MSRTRAEFVHGEDLGDWRWFPLNGVHEAALSDDVGFNRRNSRFTSEMIDWVGANHRTLSDPWGDTGDDKLYDRNRTDYWHHWTPAFDSTLCVGTPTSSLEVLMSPPDDSSDGSGSSSDKLDTDAFKQRALSGAPTAFDHDPGVRADEMGDADLGNSKSRLGLSSSRNGDRLSVAAAPNALHMSPNGYEVFRFTAILRMSCPCLVDAWFIWEKKAVGTKNYKNDEPFPDRGLQMRAQMRRLTTPITRLGKGGECAIAVTDNVLRSAGREGTVNRSGDKWRVVAYAKWNFNGNYVIQSHEKVVELVEDLLKLGKWNMVLR